MCFLCNNSATWQLLHDGAKMRLLEAESSCADDHKLAVTVAADALDNASPKNSWRASFAPRRVSKTMPDQRVTPVRSAEAVWRDGFNQLGRGQKVVITRTVAASLADAGVALLCPDRDCDRGRL